MRNRFSVRASVGVGGCGKVVVKSYRLEVKSTVSNRRRAGYESRTRLTALGRLGTADIPIPQRCNSNTLLARGKCLFERAGTPACCPPGHPKSPPLAELSREGGVLTF